MCLALTIKTGFVKPVGLHIDRGKTMVPTPSETSNSRTFQPNSLKFRGSRLIIVPSIDKPPMLWTPGNPESFKGDVSSLIKQLVEVTLHCFLSYFLSETGLKS